MTEGPSIPIAIVGMSCRLAGGATDPEKLWQLCEEGRTGWSKTPSDRFNIDGHFHPRPDHLNTTNVIGACFLQEDIGLFDAAFFGLSSEIAACLDPQFRMMLESTYEAFENAGLSMQQVNGSNTSVYAGSFFKDYHDAGLRDVTTLPRSFLIGVGSAMASNRLSHYFDLRGASMSIDTGCSTTLVALHQACNDLRNGESSMSVVSGSNLILNPDMFITMSSVQMLSKDGRSFAFDSRANGYGRGEGVATVVLKRLDDALRDGDPIQAVIKESALNQDGKTETITTPSQNAQIELIKRVYKKAGLDPKDTGYFEAHGTGTPTGDPLEVGAIASVFKDSRPRGQPLPIGSIKPNIGHTECASGLASIIKTVKALEKGVIPPVANFKEINPKLKLEEWNLKIPLTAEPWPLPGPLRRASVNNFGYGGANSHVILENYVPTAETESFLGSSLASKVIMLSARDETTAKSMVENLREHLLAVEIEDEEKFMHDLAYTLGQRRTTFPWVTAASASSVSELIRAIDGNRLKPRKAPNSSPRLGFVFTGQGAQWWGMGRELIQAYPVFRETIIEADGYLKEFGASYSLMDELHRDEQTTRVNEATLGQPVCVAVQVALVRLLESWGVVPSAVTSHSSGEIASAYAAGVLSLRNAMGVVYARGKLAADVAKYSDLGRGSMIAVGLGVEAAEKYIERVSSGKVVVACRNSPASVTISGDIAGIEEIEKLLKEDNVFARQLKVPTGYHSHHMQPIAKPYLDWLQANIKPEPRMREGVIYSSPVTGERMSDVAEIGAPQHWVESLTQPVLFTESFTNMCFAGPGEPSDVDHVIEIGAHAALSGPIQDIKSLDAFHGSKIGYSSCLTRKKNAVETAQALACDLIHNGYHLDMGQVNLTPRGKVLTDLPKYPWNHLIRHWYEPRMNKAHRMLSEAPHDLLGSPVTGSNRINPSWRHVIKPSSLPWLRDHGLQGTLVYPGAGFICMAIEGLVQSQQSTGGKPISGYRLRDVDILSALVIPEGDDGVEVQLTMRPCSDKAIFAKGWREFQIFSVTHDDKWTEHCRGMIRLERGTSRPATIPSLLPKQLQSTPFSTELELPQSVILEAWGESKLLTDKLVQQHGADGYLKTILPKQDQLCVALTVEAFKELGSDLAAARPGDRLEYVPHVPSQARFAKYLYSILESARLLELRDGVVTRTNTPIPPRSSDLLLEDLISHYPEHRRPNELAHLTGTHLAGILTGKEDGIKLIFGTDKGRDLVSGVYADFPLNKVGYHQMGDFLTRILSKVPRLPGQGPLRILEMGAGTGATTRQLVPLLAALGLPVEYTFTDLASSFVAAARKEFKGYPFMKFRTHDIEKSPADDLIHSQHIVIASNAVHATHSLPDSTANIRKMLRHDGLLLLLELTQPLYWCDIIFGVFEGWWLFEDGRTTAVAHPELWEKDLHSVGYGHVDWSDGHLPEIQAERVIIATASGEQFERLPLPPPPPKASQDYNHEARRAATDQYVRKYTADFSLPASSNDAVDPASSTVLITGATGSLGAHMAAHYARLPTVASVICLNRRSGADPHQRQIESLESKGIKLDEHALSKLVTFETDTSKPFLGLSEEQYATLLANVTHIVHNAWPMNAKRPLKGFERQFQVMRNLLGLAADISARRTASAQVTFQLISSIATVGHHPFHAGTPHIPEERMTIESVLPNGYGDAKFICELMLDATLHAHPSRFRAMAVRLGQVAGSTASGYWNTSEHLAFLLKSSQALGALPQLAGPVSWTPVDAVAAASADLALSPRPPHPIYHIDNPVRQPWADVLPVLAEEMGLPPAEEGGIVPFDEWIRRVRAFAGPAEDNPAAKLVDFLEGDFRRMSCGGVLMGAEKAREHSPTMRAVGPVSEEVVRRYVRAWRRERFLV